METKEFKSPSAALLLFVLLVLIFFIEMGIMVILPTMNVEAHALVDSMILTTIAFPILYILFYRPLKNQILEHKRQWEQSAKNLREKEVLMKEIHHRIKNNLTIVSSLLYMQSNYTDDENVKAMFDDSIDRIKSIALIHEKLYESKDFVEIEIKEYISSLLDELSISLNTEGKKIKLNAKVENVDIGFENLIPIGLIINELVTNSFKYAFKDNDDGEICIDLATDNEGNAVLRVSDNGEGFDGPGPGKPKSLGLKIVTTISKQLGGELTFKRENGSVFTLTMPIDVKV